MDISLYISKLLYTNDCVIIPGFGGFVGHYSPARIHPINHSFYPPSKNILFNSKLIRDDGLLIDTIAAEQKLSYAEAKKLVEEYIGEMLSKLRKGEVARLKNIGSLHRDRQGKLLFTPDESVNYLEEAFGLNTFQSPPVLRQSTGKRTENLFIDRKPAVPGENSKRKRVWIYAAALPVLLFIAWFVFFGRINLNTNQHAAGLNPFDTQRDNSAAMQPDKKPVKAVNPPLESLNFNTQEPEEKVEEVRPEKSIPEKPVPSKNYYIIGGSFGVETNADKLVGVLREKGYDAFRAGISPSGLHMVSYMSTADKQEALANLAMIRRDDNPSAWLIRK
jgi:nucleoid DNA-binding protein